MTYEAFKERFQIKLNAQQEKAVRAVEGPVLLLAVPGSGKTTVLVTRLGYMIHGCGIMPENILTMTYTVSATRDMRGRFAALFGDELANRLEFRTINGVSARIIRYYEKIMGRQAFDLINDEKELASLTSGIYHRVTGEFPTDSDIKGVRTAITYAKNQMLSQEEIREMDKDIKGFSTMYREYDRALKARGCMDYDDQMVYAWQILRKYPDILAAFQRRYRYICVDEAQDTSKIQHQIIRLLAGSGNLFMVGDEDQSIYGFRAAYPQALLEFEKVHKNAQVLLMEQNYRSTEQIVAAADRFIQQNGERRPKHMTAARGEGKAVREIELNERKNQYRYLLQVAKECRQETAVLYRDNDCALPLMDLLEREGVPYRCRLMDGNFFTNRVTRDIADIIRLALDPADGEIFLRVYYKFGAGISKAAAESAVARSGGRRPIFDVLREDSSISDWTEKKCAALQNHLFSMVSERADKAVYRILHFMGYGEYLSLRGMDLNRAHILEALGEREPTPARLLERLEELREIVGEKTAEPDSDFILSTIHSSKGLEYDRVILMDVIDSILPKKGEDVSIDEERRLFYVGMTRARDELMVFTFRKPGYGSEFARSVFQKESANKSVPKPLSPVQWGSVSSYQAAKTSQSAAKLADFTVGRNVFHRQFGLGTIAARQGELVTIVFADGQSKKLSLPVALQAKVLRMEAKK